MRDLVLCRSWVVASQGGDMVARFLSIGGGHPIGLGLGLITMAFDRVLGERQRSREFSFWLGSFRHG